LAVLFVPIEIPVSLDEHRVFAVRAGHGQLVACQHEPAFDVSVSDTLGVFEIRAILLALIVEVNVG